MFQNAGSALLAAEGIESAPAQEFQVDVLYEGVAARS
jgi:hypothetical protein